MPLPHARRVPNYIPPRESKEEEAYQEFLQELHDQKPEPHSDDENYEDSEND